VANKSLVIGNGSVTDVFELKCACLFVLFAYLYFVFAAAIFLPFDPWGTSKAS
jgi:uncharacterized membrane protein